MLVTMESGDVAFAKPQPMQKLHFDGGFTGRAAMSAVQRKFALDARLIKGVCSGPHIRRCGFSAISANGRTWRLSRFFKGDISRDVTILKQL